jgi:hypothetical protein
MKYYKVNKFTNCIEPYEGVLKETKNFVVMDAMHYNRMHKKDCDFYILFPTYKEAAEWTLKKIQKEILMRKEDLIALNYAYKRIESTL